MRELAENDRIVGGTTQEATKVTAEFYREFVAGEVLETDAKTAKLTENSFRDTNIAFANELSMLCDKFGINVWELIKLANKSKYSSTWSRGRRTLYSGRPLVYSSRWRRECKAEWVIEKIKNAALAFEAQNGRKAKVACMGLAFKPDIDDLRESPALYIARRLKADGLDVIAVEPNIQVHKEFEIVDYKQADIVTFLVAHKEFKKLEIETDFCGVLNK